MYSNIEEEPILIMCSWYLSCCTLAPEGDAKIHFREHHTSRDVVRPTTWVRTVSASEEISHHKSIWSSLIQWVYSRLIVGWASFSVEGTGPDTERFRRRGLRDHRVFEEEGIGNATVGSFPCRVWRLEKWVMLGLRVIMDASVCMEVREDEEEILDMV